jgi:16S rRNA (guanine527-N7)-methyltransferase
VKQQRLVRLVELMLAAPVRVTATGRGDAFERHVEDALEGAPAVAAGPPGPLVDVGAGGGIPGLVLAIEFPERPTTLVEATGRKATFLREAAAALELANVEVVAERAEAYGAAAGRDRFAVATCRALAPPPVALELCLPLVRPGGRLVAYTGAVETDPLARVASLLGGRLAEAVPVAGTERRHIVVVEKDAPTPPGFPRRPGMAAKRPLPGS